MNFVRLIILSISLLVHFSAFTQDFTIDQQKKLSDLKGKVVYIDFWASWCKPCRASFPWMNMMHAKYRDQGLEIIGINLDETKINAEKFLKILPADFTMVYDPEGTIAQQYELVGMPSSYLIDKNGVIRASHQGFFMAQTKRYENEIKRLLEE